VHKTIASIQVPAELDARAIISLSLAIKQAVDDEATRVLVLQGADGDFCRGMSLAGLASPEPNDDPAEAVRTFARCLEILRFAEKPTIAVVDGVALGGGLGIVAACDLVLATPRATFGLPELLFGLLPAVVLPILLERMPAQKVRLLALRATSVSADRARDLGLVDEVVLAEDLPRAVRHYARALSRTAPGAAVTLKRYVAEAAGIGLTAGLSRGAGLTAALLAGGSVRDSIQDFVAGGTLPWLTR
jgi:enoyl-CoA hydratase/carnithine racemase